MDVKEINSFPELIINLIATQILDAIISNPRLQYQQIEEALITPRETNFQRYINESLNRSNFHLIECDHEPFLFDNRVNRLIKYCSRLLLGKTLVSEMYVFFSKSSTHLMR